MIFWPTKLALVRLEREAEARKVKPEELLARLVEVLGTDDLYGAILDR
jgi:hypothetical protein